MYVERRCSDLKENPKRMIDSILERKRRRITLDKVLVRKSDGMELITDPSELNEQINLHFQTSAKAVDVQPDLNDRWTKQYAPKSLNLTLTSTGMILLWHRLMMMSGIILLILFQMVKQVMFLKYRMNF